MLRTHGLAVALALVAVMGVATDSRAQPSQPVSEPVVVELCGRGLGGRCLKGRQACNHGTRAQCAAWQTWSARCNVCAEAFATCRARVGGTAGATCDKCVAAHDACENRIRVTR